MMQRALRLQHSLMLLLRFAGEAQCTLYPFTLQSHLASNQLWNELQHLGFNWARRTTSDESLQASWYSQLLQSLNSWCTQPNCTPQDALNNVFYTEVDNPETHWSTNPAGLCGFSDLEYTIVCRTWVRSSVQPHCMSMYERATPLQENARPRHRQDGAASGGSSSPH